MTAKMLLFLALSVCLALFGTEAAASASPENLAGDASELAVGTIPLPIRTVAPAFPPSYTIRHEAPEVRLQFTISDGRGHAVSRISRADFQVLDNQRAVIHIRDFTQSDDLPVHLGVLLDVSDSVKKSFAREQQAVQFVVEHLLRSQSDRVLLATFSRDTSLRQGFTGDREALFQAASKISQQGHATYLFDSLYHVCLDQFSPDPSSETAQRILLLISDGNDTGSVHSLEEAIMIAQRRGIQIYTLAFHSSPHFSVGDEVLKRLADTTGGEFLVANSERDLPGLCATLEQQMHTQFAVSFQPAELTPGFHSVQVQLLRNSKLSVHARQGYFLGKP